METIWTSTIFSIGQLKRREKQRNMENFWKYYFPLRGVDIQASNNMYYNFFVHNLKV